MFEILQTLKNVPAKKVDDNFVSSFDLRIAKIEAYESKNARYDLFSKYKIETTIVFLYVLRR